MRAWVFVLRGVHAYARVLRVLAFGCTHVLGITCACFHDARRVYVLRGVDAHARVLRVPSFGCTHVLGITYACFLDACVGVCA
jgi:predicted signal transduction protein with EAL and GGDEF domain